MHIQIKKKTKATKKNTAKKGDAKPVKPVPAIVPDEPEEEWVTLPAAGDCIVMRVDNEASTNHLPTKEEVAYMKRQPTETKRYLAIVTGVLTAPTKRKPWCTCIVHILPPPPAAGGVIQDFQPRVCNVVRLRPRQTRRAPMLSVAPGLLALLFKDAAYVGAHLDARPLSWAAELEQEHWVTTRWVFPAGASARRTTVLPPNAVLYVPETDGWQLADFDYEWRGPFGTPQAYSYEHNLICNKILLVRACKILATEIADPAVLKEEALTVQRGVFERVNACAKASQWASVTQTVGGVTTTHDSGQRPKMSAYAHHRAMSMP